MLIPIEALRRFLREPISGVLHVGAHAGEECDIYRVLGIGEVVWIEANERVLPALRTRVEPLGHRVIHALVSDAVGYDVFHVANNTMSSSLLPLGTHKQFAPEIGYVYDIVMPTTTLDVLARSYDFSRLNFLNLDVQGAELRVLRGAQTVLGNMQYVYAEVNLEPVYVGCALLPELDEFLFQRGFQRVLTKLTSHGWGDALYVRSV